MSLENAPRPMTIREAVEAAKILIPHVVELRRAEGAMDLLHLVIERVSTDDPLQVMRFVALMYHMPVEEVVPLLADGGRYSLASALARGLATNPLPDLIEMARGLGLTREGWLDARAD